MESVYRISNSRICHIHGGIPPYCSEPPVIGHGNKTPMLQRQKWQKECEEVFDEGGASMNRAFALFYERTLKDTDYYMSRNIGFFKRAQSVDKVYVIGHSLGEVDMPYFKALPLNVPWMIYYHREEEKEPFEETIKSIGVKCVEMKLSEDFWTK